MKLLAVFLATLIGPSALALPLQVQRGEFDSGEVDVSVDFGGTPVTMKLDTGSFKTQFPSDKWNAGYPILRQEKREGAGGIPYTCDVIRLSPTAIDGLSLGTYEADRCPVGSSSLFGLDFFSGHRLDFNFKAATLEINRPGSIPPNPLRTYPKGNIGMSVRMNGQPLYGIFDTGAGLSSVDQAFVDRNPGSFDYVQDLSGGDGDGNAVRMKLYRLKALELGGTQVTDQYFAAFDFGADLRKEFGADTPLILGFNIISAHDWAIDLKNGAWSVGE